MYSLLEINISFLYIPTALKQLDYRALNHVF